MEGRLLSIIILYFLYTVDKKGRWDEGVNVLIKNKDTVQVIIRYTIRVLQYRNNKTAGTNVVRNRCQTDTQITDNQLFK